MSNVVQITSPSQFSSVLSGSRNVVANFYSPDDAICAAINPLYEQLAGQLSRPNILSFTMVDIGQQSQIAQSYRVSVKPTFIIFKNGREVSNIRGAKLQELSDAIKRLAAEAESAGDSGNAGAGSSSSSGAGWRGADLPRGYKDITDQIDVRGIDLMNWDSDFGNIRTLIETSAPSSLGKGKGAVQKDWVESDVDEQLMLFLPFTSTIKAHTIQLTSLPPNPENDDEVPMRPRTIRLYTNRTHNLGFEEADDIPATQTLELKPTDWDDKTGTAKLELRFVKFQNISSLVVFVENGDGESDKVRLDRIRIIGESGEKREMGKLEKIGDDS